MNKLGGFGAFLEMRKVCFVLMCGRISVLVISSSIIRHFLWVTLLFSYFCLNISAASSLPQPTLNFSLQGKMEGVSFGLFVLQYKSEESYIEDTSFIKNGQFNFQGYLNEPTEALLTASFRSGQSLITKNAVLYIEPGNMTLSIQKDDFDKLTMTGSQSHEEWEALQLLIMEKSLSIKKELRDSFRLEIQNVEWNFIKAHPKSFVSVDLLQRFDANETLPLDSLKLVFDKLDMDVQNSSTGKEIKRAIDKKISNSIGSYAPDFRTLDLQGDTISLSMFRNKSVVLMDFWASWCAYCRKDFEHVKKLYDAFHINGFEVIAVSLDKDRAEWKEAVQKDGTGNWHHVLFETKIAEGLSTETMEEINAYYDVKSVPVQLLIDRNGKIVGRWKGSSERNKVELDVQLRFLLPAN